jgi:hypothetical protein
VTIVSGDTPIDSPAVDAGLGDVVAMDDFIFGEPVNPGDCADDCPADLNGDGMLDLADVNEFVVAFTSQDPAADLDDNGVLDLGDIADLRPGLRHGLSVSPPVPGVVDPRPDRDAEPDASGLPIPV